MSRGEPAGDRGHPCWGSCRGEGARVALILHISRLGPNKIASAFLADRAPDREANLAWEENPRERRVIVRSLRCRVHLASIRREARVVPAVQRRLSWRPGESAAHVRE